MAEDTVRIGFVGAGANTTLRHIPGFKAIEGVELVSVANRSRASGQRIADEYGLPQVFDNWVDLVEDPDTNAICIGTWPYMHHALVLAALEYDKHVITEAPHGHGRGPGARHAIRRAAQAQPRHADSPLAHDAEGG